MFDDFESATEHSQVCVKVILPARHLNAGVCGSAEYRQRSTNKINKMLKKIVKLIPSEPLNALYDAVFDELVKRGDIQFPDEDSCIETPYKGYLIKLRRESDQSYTTTWSIHQGEHLICKGEGESHPSLGEAESSAINWIDFYCSPSLVKSTGAN